MIKIMISLILAVAVSFASELNIKNSCSYSQEGGMVVSFEAYKTPDKIGVKGAFDSVDFKPARLNGNKLRDIFVGSTVNINTKSVNTENKKRDAKLMKFFFDNLTGEIIKGKVVDIKPNKMAKDEESSGIFIVNITMNGVSKNIPMSYTYSNDILTATGVVNILEFRASKALTAINEACYDLHKGKTWSSVTIGFSTRVKFELCYVKR